MKSKNVLFSQRTESASAVISSATALSYTKAFAKAMPRELRLRKLDMKLSSSFVMTNCCSTQAKVSKVYGSLTL